MRKFQGQDENYVKKSDSTDCDGSVNREMQLLQLQHTSPGCMMSVPRFQSNTFILAPHES